MNAEMRENLRISLLRYLNAAERVDGMKLGLLLAYARDEGFGRLEPDALQAELLYLEDKQLAIRNNKVMSPENARWRITANGRDFLAVELGQ